MGGSWSRRRRPGGGTEGGADGGDTLSGVPRRVALAVTASYVVLTAACGVGGDHPLVAAGMPSPRGTAITGPGSASPTAAGSGEAGSPPALTGTCTAFAALMPGDAVGASTARTALDAWLRTAAQEWSDPALAWRAAQDLSDRVTWRTERRELVAHQGPNGTWFVLSGRSCH